MNQHSLSYIKGIFFATFSDNELIGMIRYANHPENAYFPSPSGKIILFTKKNTTIDTPPFNTVVPILYNHPGTNIPATATQIQLIEFTIQVTIQNAIRYQNA